MNSSVQPIAGRECGSWISKEQRWCHSPAVYDCPLCHRHACLACSPVGKSPSKRRCCMRPITDGEVEAWKRGDVAHAKALIMKQEVQRRVRWALFMVADHRAITEGDIEHALKAANHWASVGSEYLKIRALDPLNHDEHTRIASVCAGNAATLAQWAQEWAVSEMGPKPTKTVLRRGLTLITSGPDGEAS